MSDGLLQIGSLWVWILIAFVLLIVLVVIVLSSVVRRSAEVDEEPSNDKKAGAEPPPAEVDAAAEPRLGESAATSFSRALAFLKEAVGGRDYRYRIPWFLVLGEAQSGKSALVSSTGIDLTARSHMRAAPGDALEWRFLDSGILIVPNGRYIRGGGREYDWGKLLGLFQNHRPRRPLDGVVLAISATDLAGPAALDETQLTARAARISEMLSQAQRTLGFSFPVYVAVTKCDEIPGFGSFCRELPGRNHEDILGWSSPYHLDASFSPDWVDEAFTQVGHDVQRLQSEVFVERASLRDADSVFLFPEEFDRLHIPLRCYLDRLFRETAYRESFRFRGVYFCGDISEPLPDETMPLPRAMAAAAGADGDETPPEVLALNPPPPSAPLRTAKKSPAFVRQLFELKIFPEGGVARPLSRVFLARSRTVAAIQIVAAALALILLIGTLWNDRRLRADEAKLTPVLQRMLLMPKTREADRHTLMLSMASAGDVRFRSVFFPASLFSPLDDDVTKVMVYGCDTWVLGNLRSSLEQAVNTTLSPPRAGVTPKGDGGGVESADGGDGAAPPAASDNGPAAASSDVESLSEFDDLDSFVKQLDALQDNVATYDALRQHGNIGDINRIRQLVQFLYHANLDDFQANGHFAQALRQVDGPPFTPTADQINLASSRMLTLVDQLFDRWLGDSALTADIDQLKLRIGQLEQGSISSREGLDRLLKALTKVDDDFRSPGYRWASSQTLDLSGPLERVILHPLVTRKNPFLLPDTLGRVQRLGNDYLQSLRTNLAEQRTPMTDQILDLRDTARLSTGSRKLEMALENALNLRFMSMAGSRTIRYTLDPGTRLIWHPEFLQEAVRLLDIYTRFTDEGLLDAPPRLRSVLSSVALDQLKRNAQDLVAQAQEFQARTVTGGVGASLVAQDETLPEVNSFRESYDSLMLIANRFGDLKATDIRNSTMRIMVLQAYNLLTILDRRLGEEDPYTSKEGNFGWWNGKGSLAFDSYQVRNASELAEYLNTQRERIKFLEQQSEPLVQFLNTALPTRGEAQTRLITKWERIIADYKQYDGKKPGASLAALEDFILNRLDKVTPDNACKDVEPESEGRVLNQDYFQMIRSSLRSSVVARCRFLSSQGVYSAYSEIADLFNRTLAGSFPFGPLGNADKPAVEAAPEAIVEFFRLYDRNVKTARSTLKEDPRFADSAGPALAFLDEMEAVRPLVVPASADAEKEPPLTVDFTPHFRSNQAAEVGGNQIIDWTMQAGGQIFRTREPDHPGRWRTGNPIRLSLRWANDSTYLPAPDNQPNLKIRGERNAFFEYTNRWALLAFLRRQQAAPSEIRQPAEPQTYVLKFSLKQARDPKWTDQDSVPASANSVVFMSVRLQKPGSKDALILPAFPVSAPRLNQPVTEKE
jgi:type VI secretion system protein ImpL